MFLVIYEKSLAPRKYGAMPTAYDDWQEADAAAKQCAKDRKCRAWVGELSDPPLLEIPTGAEIYEFKK